jgi:hypothetical protein
MTSTERQILENLRTAILGSTGQRHPIMMGTVVADSVDEGAMTCSVLLSVDGTDSPTEGVLLNALQDNTDGVIPVPNDESVVWVAELDGPGKFGVVRCSTLKKVLVKIGDVTGELSNGLVDLKQGDAEVKLSGGKISLKNGSADLKTILNNVLSHIQALTVPTGTGPSGVPINVADFVTDNSKVNQLLF